MKWILLMLCPQDQQKVANTLRAMLEMTANAFSVNLHGIFSIVLNIASL